MSSKVALVTTVLGVLASATVGAQVRDLPVFNNAFGVTGVRIDGHVAFPRVGGNGANGSVYAASAAAGFGPITLRATAGLRNLGDDDPLAPIDDQFAIFGASAAYRIFGGGVWPFSINVQGGVGFENQNEGLGAADPSVIRYVGNVGLAARPMVPGVSIQPWVSGGIRVVNFDVDGAGTSTNFGLSGGVDVTLPSGLGFHVAADRETRDFPVQLGGADVTRSVFTIALGIHWGFQLPSSGL